MRPFIFLLCVIVLVLPFSAFAQQELPPVNPAVVVGDISIAGSSILEPVTRNIVTRFTLEGYKGSVAVNANGTDAAFEQLCAAMTDIVLADRQITPQEVDACTAVGRPPIGFRVSTSAVVVTVSSENDFVININTAELQQIFSAALTWSEIRANWTGDPISRFGPSPDSNSFDLFSTVVFGGDRNALITAVGAQYNNDQSANAQSIAASINAIGFFEANFALANSTTLRGVALNNVTPTTETIVDNTYPLSRPLLIYTTSQEFEEQAQVVDFLNYYLTNIEIEANAVGLYPPPDTSLQIARNRWLDASGQTALIAATSNAQIPPTATPLDPIALTATALASTVDNIPLATPIPEVQPTIDPSQIFTPEIQNLLVQARLDLELTAEQLLGSERLPGWSASLDIENPQLPLLIRLDLELLAAQVYGIDDRPDNWFGAVSSTQEAISRDIRHDLEILADNIFGGTRPLDWAGADAIYRCDRSTQALVSLLQKNGLYTLTANPSSPDYCMQVATEISRFVEINLISSDINIGQGGITIPPDVTIETTIAVAFFNRSASLRAGVIPSGTGIIPIARSYQGFSNMTLVQGEGFLIFIEWQNTSLTQDEWETLPDEAGLEYEANCAADWCEVQG